MYKIFLLATCFFVSAQVLAQSPFPPYGVTIAGGNGAGLAANQLNEPNNITFDAAGNLLIADQNNHRIQKWAPGATQGVTILGGNGRGIAPNQFARPTDVLLDAAGNFYVCDKENHRVQKFAPGSTTGVTVAGGNGAGSAANQLYNPSGIFIDAAGNIFIADYSNGRVQKWAPGATAGTTVAGGNGTGPGPNQLWLPNDVFVDKNGALYTTDQYNGRILKFLPGSANGILVAGSNGGGSAANQLYIPTAFVIDSANNIYVADFGNNRIQLWRSGATTGITVAGGNGRGSAADQFDGPVNLAFDAAGNLIVSEAYNDRIQRFDLAPGCPANSVIPATSCSGKTVIRWTEPKDSFPRIIKIPDYLDPAAGSLTYLDTFSRHGYYISSGLYTWPDAKDIAEYLGDTGVNGHLATISSAAENTFLTNLISRSALYPWIGLYSTGKPGSFRWATGEPLTYTNWASGEPNNFTGNAANLTEPYVHLYPSGQWNDQHSNLQPFVAEFEQPLVRFRQISGVSNGSEQSPGVYMICYERANTITGARDTCCFSVTIRCASATAAAPAQVTVSNESTGFAGGISVKAFPNPTSTQFTINLSSSSREKITVQITDITGKIVERRIGLAANQSIQAGSNLKPGIYFVEVKQGGQKVQLKVVKQ